MEGSGRDGHANSFTPAVSVSTGRECRDSPTLAQLWLWRPLGMRRQMLPFPIFTFRSKIAAVSIGGKISREMLITLYDVPNL